MPKIFERARSRLLVICRNTATRNDLVTLLTGYGYYVDYADSMSAGVLSYREHKQPIVILDVPSLPIHPENIFKSFSLYKRNPIVLVAAFAEEELAVYPYLQQGVYDIVQLPLRPGYHHFVLRRLVNHNHVVVENEFLRNLIALILLGIPVFVAVLIYL